MALWIEAEWPAPPGVRLISTLRSGGVSRGRYHSLNLGNHVQDDGASVVENRRILRLAASLPAEPSWLQQVHGVGVANLDNPSFEMSADASVTRRFGTVCAVLTADCLPIALASESGNVVAAIHAGWRGLAAGVIESAAGALGLPGGQLLAWLGPAIGPRNFEVGPEVREAFVAEDNAAQGAFRTNPRGRFLADLGLLARQRLERLGIVKIYGGGQCTYADSQRFFSHRRDGITGRQATLIWREPARDR